MYKYKRTSKFLSMILRHRPEIIGIKLDDNGWADVSELLEGMNKKGHEIDMSLLEDVVTTNEKQRFSFNEDKSKIRANQGHSIQIELSLPVSIPPDILYHGTAGRNIEGIMNNGLQKKNRNHVHLSLDKETAVIVGQRHGKPIVLEIDAKTMVEDGYVFYISENGVWLTDEVPVKYIKTAERFSIVKTELLKLHLNMHMKCYNMVMMR